MSNYSFKDVQLILIGESDWRISISNALTLTTTMMSAVFLCVLALESMFLLVSACLPVQTLHGNPWWKT